MIRVNTLWPSDTIWHQRSWSTLFQVIAWCLMAPSYYLNQCWPIINEILRHAFNGNFYLDTQDINVVFEICTFEIIATFPGGHWINRSIKSGYSIINEWFLARQRDVTPELAMELRLFCIKHSRLYILRITLQDHYNMLNSLQDTHIRNIFKYLSRGNGLGINH